MTKDKLVKEAEEWLKSNIKTENREGITFNIVPTPVQIYCAGAEPREKRIEELVQENVNLNSTLDLRRLQLDDSAEIIKEMQSKVDTLKKENAELKNRVDNIFNSDCWASSQLTKAKEQLERAKRIIEELHEIVVSKVEYKSTILMWNTMARAEKLLKEI